MNFNCFSLNPILVDNSRKAGYKTPTPIQEQAIPKIIQGGDLMGVAQTGTGKTAAFILPILHRLMKNPSNGIRVLIVAPTRELVEQIHATIQVLGRGTKLRSTVIYGGVSINPQIQALKQADIVVSCPGRLLDHITRSTIHLSRLKILVFDEADQMFDMGFYPDIRRILTHLPLKNRQTLLFSATMPDEIRHLADEILRNPAYIRIGLTAPPETVNHALFPVAPHLKTHLLIKLLGQSRADSVLVFTRTKVRAKRLCEKLTHAGYRSTSLRGDMSQGRRMEALNNFRSGKAQILVATDIAARGIDVSHISHVINFDIPTTTEAYIHRVGRTGRAQHAGKAFTLITSEDSQMVKAINRSVGSPVKQCILADFNYDAPLKPANRKGNDINGGGGGISRPIVFPK